MAHEAVMLQEVLDALDPQPGQIALDGTLGWGGHASAILDRLGGAGTLVGLDLDPSNLEQAGLRLTPIAEASGATVHRLNRNFASAAGALRELGLDGVDLLLVDLGFASNHVDDAQRGFSFRHDGPLDMRYNRSLAGDASALVNSLPEEELDRLIRTYGEERHSKRIARKIIAIRGENPILTTRQFADVVASAVPPGPDAKRIHPATRTFQALRIAVNGELDALDGLLAASPRLMNPGGRTAVITFHSLEDRAVKRAMLAWQDQGLGQVQTSKPIVAGDAEIARNPRSRSAKLRAFEWAAPIAG